MAKPSLIFHEIRLGGMPGFELDDRFTVRGLGGGLTVVHGPNGIGKTTLARAMQLLMWSDLPAGRTVHLEARASLAGAEQRRLRSGDSLSVRGADGAELDDPEQIAVLDGMIDDPDGVGGPSLHARQREEDPEGWDLDAPLAAVSDDEDGEGLKEA